MREIVNKFINRLIMGLFNDLNRSNFYNIISLLLQYYIT